MAVDKKKKGNKPSSCRYVKSDVKWNRSKGRHGIPKKSGNVKSKRETR